ncbi:PAMP-induced secreted peptide 2-like isoform X2 [Fagus crenata]
MTANPKHYSFFVIFLLLNSVFIATEARTFNVMELRGTVSGGCGGYFNWLSLGAIKQSGPKLGDGHKSTNDGTLEGIKQSVPSPGMGHTYVNGVGN